MASSFHLPPLDCIWTISSRVISTTIASHKPTQNVMLCYAKHRRLVLNALLVAGSVGSPGSAQQYNDWHWFDDGRYKSEQHDLRVYAGEQLAPKTSEPHAVVWMFSSILYLSVFHKILPQRIGRRAGIKGAMSLLLGVWLWMQKG